jgi:hypothetical protein
MIKKSEAIKNVEFLKKLLKNTLSDAFFNLPIIEDYIINYSQVEIIAIKLISNIINNPDEESYLESLIVKNNDTNETETLQFYYNINGSYAIVPLKEYNKNIDKNSEFDMKFMGNYVTIHNNKDRYLGCVKTLEPGFLWVVTEDNKMRLISDSEILHDGHKNIWTNPYTEEKLLIIDINEKVVF